MFDWLKPKSQPDSETRAAETRKAHKVAAVLRALDDDAPPLSADQIHRMSVSVMLAKRKQLAERRRLSSRVARASRPAMAFGFGAMSLASAAVAFYLWIGQPVGVPSVPTVLQQRAAGNTTLVLRAPSILSDGSVQMDGKVAPGSALRINDVPVSVDENGNFVYRGPAPEQGRLHVVAREASGQETRLTRLVN